MNKHCHPGTGIHGSGSYLRIATPAQRPGATPFSAHNARVGKAHISCCICLSQGRRVEAVTTVHGYSVCEPHVGIVSDPHFDIFTLRGGRETRGTAV
jgi:hypothetical protein